MYYLDNYYNHVNLSLTQQLAPMVVYEDNSLKIIEKNIINLAKSRNLPLNSLSFNLINLNSINQQSISYNQTKIRYPASIVKLFWLVIFLEKYNKNQSGINSLNSSQINQLLKDMIQNSNNESSSKIVDLITGENCTIENSSKKIKGEDLQTMIIKRYEMNDYFLNKGFQNLNITQKTLPIYSLGLDKAKGFEFQLRYPNNEEKPIRNYLTSESVATLLYQIYNQQFTQSEEMLSLLKRDLNPSAWQDIPFNSIKGFLGEGLTDKNVNFYSKMGWTFSNRNDAAIVVSPDGKISYILVILGDDPAYYKDVEFLPLVSRMVYEEMSKLSSP